MSNAVRYYVWGSTSVIPTLLGVPSDGRPHAELWLGAHADAPSCLSDGTRLDDAIAAEPRRHLGAEVLATYGPRLPYLMKVLAAAAPLSLQVHPTSEQAGAGYDDEQARAVPSDAAHRRYRDRFHKPEMVVALSTFEALCGLREARATSSLLDLLRVEHPAWPNLRDLVSTAGGTTALRATVTWLLGDDERVPSLVEAVSAAAALHAERPEFATTVDLAKAYPRDPGVLVALLLNRVTLAPGEALFLPAGNLHAYLRGTAIEIMAASDNVLRAGLTAKYIDVAELLRVADFTARPMPTVVPKRVGPLTFYRPHVAEFAFVRADLDDWQRWCEVRLHGPRIVLALDGEVEVAIGDQDPERLGCGESVYIAAVEGDPLRVRGAGAAVIVGSPTADARRPNGPRSDS